MSDTLLNRHKIQQVAINKREQLLSAYKVIVLAHADTIDKQIREALKEITGKCVVNVTVPADKNIDVYYFGEAFYNYITEDLDFLVDDSYFKVPTELSTPSFIPLAYKRKKWIHVPNYLKRKWYQIFSEKQKVSYTFYICVDISAMVPSSINSLIDEDFT